MAPFPEAEIMTIKRLEVALRKMDYKLLKDGAYKLHEKYHGGHKFEYFDLLKEIFLEISNNPSIPTDVKDILSPTIEDILAQQGIETNTTTSPYESFNHQETSNETTQNEHQTETKINAFDAFSAPKETVQPHRYFTQSPFSAQPFKEFHPIEHHQPIHSQTVQSEPEQKIQEENQIQEQYQQPTFEAVQKEETQAIQEQSYSQQVEQAEQVEQVEQQTAEAEAPQKKKTIAIYYAQNNSNEKIKNISKLRELISSSRDKNSSIDDILSLISEISIQSDTNVFELKGIIEQLNLKGNSANLITNSQSANFVELLNSTNVTYSLYDNNEDNKINIIPVNGLSNLFVCEECNEKYLNKNNGIKPLILECPKCKHPMYPDFYSGVEEAKINMNYYNKALINLANSTTWLLIHPTYNSSIDINIIKSALNVSSKVEEIYIVDKDINAREQYRAMIAEINPEIKVNIQSTVLEDFLNNI